MFKKKKYTVIRQAISKELASFITNYFIMRKQVLDTCRQLQREGFEVDYLEPMENGLLDMEVFKKTLREDTVLVSIMHVNNEIGVIQDIGAIGEITREKGIIFHVDAARCGSVLSPDSSIGSILRVLLG